MQYKSPIRFFEYSNIVVSDPEAINVPRARKLIAAEFNMEPSGIIRLEGIDYNKQDILGCLESPHRSVELAFHHKVWEQKSLLHFLESGRIEEHFGEQVEQAKEDVAFVGFCSPYFAVQFNKEMKQRLSRNDFPAAANWIMYCEMILLADGEAAFAGTASYLEQAIRLFRNLNKTTFLTRKEEVAVWTQPWARFVNWLPDNLYSLKDDLATVLINFCVEIQHADEQTCFLISKQMTELDYVDPSNARLIRENHEIYAEKVAGTYLNPDGRRMVSQKKTSSPNYIWIILICVITFVRLFDKGCNDRSSGNIQKFSVSGGVLANELFFEQARKVGIAQNSSADPQTLDSAVQTLPVYLNFFQSVDASEAVSLAITNETGAELYLFVRDKAYSTVTLPIAHKETLKIRRESVYAIDFILDTVRTLHLSTMGNLECFYLHKKGLKQVYEQYSDSAAVSVNDTTSHKQVRLVISTRDGRFYIRSADQLRIFRRALVP